MRKRIAGFTLIELIFCVAIVSVLCVVSVPALGGLLMDSQARASGNAVVTALNLARISAANRQDEVVLCPSSDQRHCTGGVWWQNGWIVFQDLDHDGARSDIEPILSVAQAQAGMAIASTSGRQHVTYRPDGSATGTNVTITLCDRRGVSKASAIVINNGGRPRQGKPTTAEAAAACAGLAGQ
jgi:type IV fimbrial biogenesis protein FimT